MQVAGAFIKYMVYVGRKPRSALPPPAADPDYVIFSTAKNVYGQSKNNVQSMVVSSLLCTPHGLLLKRKTACFVRKERAGKKKQLLAMRADKSFGNHFCFVRLPSHGRLSRQHAEFKSALQNFMALSETRLKMWRKLRRTRAHGR